MLGRGPRDDRADAASRPGYHRRITAIQPPSGPPVASVDDAIARMEAIDQALPAFDGLACFNRMYLEVTQQVQQHIQAGSFVDVAFMAHLDVVFANMYFDAVDAVSARATDLPAAWQPLLQQRTTPGIEPIQFALAGMNAHIRCGMWAASGTSL
jgi:hypothetical protein